MKKTFLALAAIGLVGVACDGAMPTTPAADDAGSPLLARRGPMVHHVSAGGPDICEATGQPTGCDANYSLVANEKADGSVAGP